MTRISQLAGSVTEVATTARCEAVGQAGQTQMVEADFMDGFTRTVARLAQHDSSAWECQTARRLRSIDLYEDFLALLDDAEVNARIFALDVIGRCGWLLSSQAQSEIRLVLCALQSDHAANEYMYGGFQAEEESLSTVARAARNALISLDCAAGVEAAARGEPRAWSAGPQDIPMAQIDHLRALLQACQDQMGDTAFWHRVDKLAPDVQSILWRVLGGNSSVEIVEAVAVHDFQGGSAAQPTRAAMGPACAKSRVLLGVLEGRFQLAGRPATESAT